MPRVSIYQCGSVYSRLGIELLVAMIKIEHDFISITERETKKEIVSDEPMYPLARFISFRQCVTAQSYTQYKC